MKKYCGDFKKGPEGSCIYYKLSKCIGGNINCARRNCKINGPREIIVKE